MAIDFPFARTIVAIQSRRTTKRTGHSSLETRYYLSSQDPEERSPENWVQLVRGHWAGVENRNHWRRDVLWNEDRTPSRHPHVVGNLAVLRSAALHLINRHFDDHSHCQARESLAARPTLSLQLLRSK